MNQRDKMQLSVGERYEEFALCLLGMLPEYFKNNQNQSGFREYCKILDNATRKTQYSLGFMNSASRINEAYNDYLREVLDP